MSLDGQLASPARVLLVDDHDDTREGYAAYLRIAGYEVHTAENGREALRDIRHWRPDAILMDLMMPEMDGWRAVRLLKARRRTRSIPIVAVSAQVVDGCEEGRARAAGFEAFCKKPCLPARLLAVLRSVLHPGDGTDSAVRPERRATASSFGADDALERER